MSNGLIQPASVVSNRPICREHFRLTLRLDRFPDAGAGQFVHLGPLPAGHDEIRRSNGGHAQPGGSLSASSLEPLLRRAFSIAGLRREDLSTCVDVIYRVVGAGTVWMASLRSGDHISVMGPLGNRFPVSATKSQAWLVAGGVGLPPLLWLAEFLHARGKNVVAFLGAQSKDLLAIEWTDAAPDADAVAATLCSAEFARCGAGLVISTDDGSCGLHGHVGQAMAAFQDAHSPNPADVVVYTCGPYRMMRFVARHCAARGMECLVCMEQAMACGTGTCQSCVIPVREPSDAAGWRYALCCTEGPVFQAPRIDWDFDGGEG